MEWSSIVVHDKVRDVLKQLYDGEWRRDKHIVFTDILHSTYHLHLVFDEGRFLWRAYYYPRGAVVAREDVLRDGWMLDGRANMVKGFEELWDVHTSPPYWRAPKSKED